METPDYYIGLMSGTSLDGIDACLCDISNDGTLKLIDALTQPYPNELRQQIEKVSRKIDDHLHVLATLDHILATHYADTVLSLLKKTNFKPEQIKAIGNHGQTVRHCPKCTPPYSIQLGNPNILSALTGITVVADFRQGDIAAGGQGAPLAPKFHQSQFIHAGETIVAANLGGIANISILHADGSVTGHDTGPANTLMDQWISKHQEENYDKDGAWAATGHVNTPLLQSMLAEPWLQLLPPKSTGPELFNLGWLEQLMDLSKITPEDVQRTLCEFTALTIARAIEKHAGDAKELILCGGGAYNSFLRERLKTTLPTIRHNTSSMYGIEPSWVESAMMAWLAYRALNHLPGNIPAVTGARRELVLGVVFPPR